MACAFFLLTMSFKENKFLMILTAIFSFVDYIFKVVSKIFLPMFYTFHSFKCTFKSMIYVELIFHMVLSMDPSFLFRGLFVYQHLLLNRLLFLHWIAFALVLNITCPCVLCPYICQLLYMWIYFCTLYLYHWSICLYGHQCHTVLIT